MSVPETKSSEITEKINLLSKQDEISPFEVKALQRDIDRLKQVSASEAYMLSGMLFSILRDYPQSKSNHEKALKLSYSPVELVNFAVSMKRLGRTSEALSLYFFASELDPANPRFVSSIIQLMTFAGDFERYSEALARFQKANPEFDIQELENIKTVKSVREHLKSVDIPESEFKLAGSLVEQVLCEFNVATKRMREKLTTFDGVKHVYIEMYVNARDASELVMINERVVESLLGDERLTCWDKIVYNVVGYHRRLQELSATRLLN